MHSKLTVVLAILIWSATSFAATVENNDNKKWSAPIPTVAENNEAWQKLVPALLEHDMPNGALAASRTMLNFFQDLPSKDLAYRTIIHLVDLGYQGTVRPYFIPGDIEPDATTDYGKSYFFYKALVDIDKKMNRWAQTQFEKVDKEFFAKYVFYQGVQAYAAGQLDDAIGYLKKALILTTGEDKMSLARREARTLARIYYEKEEFEKALEIYQTFLLKLNPVSSEDWLEAAWALYRLKRYPEALGYTYNLESKAAGPTVVLEPYILRALVYREYCSVRYIDLLSQRFQKEYGKILDAIRLGEPLRPVSNMVKIELPETSEYRQSIRSLEELESEHLRVSELPKEVRPLAEYLYTAEIKMLGKRKQSLESDALQILAKHLVILSESLKFLKFEVVRQRFNPDTVFSDDKPTDTVLVENTDEDTFRLHWNQWGDFWRDERLLYRGKVVNRCDK